MSDPESWLRIGRDHALQVMILGPLFEEHNRMRRALVEMARNLDRACIGTAFPDLSGMGESAASISGASLSLWRNEAAEAARLLSPAIVVSVRGGSLLDGECKAKGWWRFAPETGSRIVRDLNRTQLAGDSDLYAGHRLPAAFLRELDAASPAPVAPLRTIRLAGDAAEADARVEGPPLWRRAEPGEDSALSAALAADLAAWVRQCAAS